MTTVKKMCVVPYELIESFLMKDKLNKNPSLKLEMELEKNKQKLQPLPENVEKYSDLM